MHTIEIKIGQETFNLKAITLGQYMNFLASVENATFKEGVLDILGSTAGLNLTKVSKEQLFVTLLAKSTTMHPKTQYVCECGAKRTIELNYTHLHQVIPQSDTVHSEMYQLKGFKVKLKYPTNMFCDDNMYDLILSCIDGIYTSNDVLQLDDLSELEMDNFVAAFSVQDVLNIKEYLLAPYIQLAIPVSCDCGKSGVKHIKGLEECIEVLL